MQNSTDRAMNVKTPLGCVVVLGGTWTIAWSGAAFVLQKTPAADTSYLQMPIFTILNPQAGKGARLVSVDCHFVNTVADLTSLTAYFYKAVLPPTWGVLARSTVAFTYDTGNDTAAERRSQRVSRLTATLDIPAYPVSNEDWHFELEIISPANSEFQLYGFVANYLTRD